MKNKTIAIIDYKMGNLGSVKKAFEHFDADIIITNNKDDIKNSSAIILPGVGAFNVAMMELDKLNLIEIIKSEIKKGKNIFGICLGYQLLFEKSDEGSTSEGLGIINGQIKRLDISLKIPHIGWNEVKCYKKGRLASGVKDGEYFYFVHSFYAENVDKNDILLTTDYEKEFVCGIERDNIFGVQFHPEKSQDSGLKIIKNFKELI